MLEGLDSERKVILIRLGYIDLLTVEHVSTDAHVLGIEMSERVVETVDGGNVHIDKVYCDRPPHMPRWRERIIRSAMGTRANGSPGSWRAVKAATPPNSPA